MTTIHITPDNLATKLAEREMNAKMEAGTMTAEDVINQQPALEAEFIDLIRTFEVK